MRKEINLATGEITEHPDAPAIPETPEQAAIRIENEAKAKLAELDAKSIRSIREYIAAKADAPQILKDHETAAQAERAKLKK